MKLQLLTGALLASAVAVQATPAMRRSDGLFNKEPATPEEEAKWDACTKDFVANLGGSATGTSEACTYVDCMGQVANEFSRGGVLGIAAAILGGPCAVIDRIDLK